jgi:hypothetical protein
MANRIVGQRILGNATIQAMRPLINRGGGRLRSGSVARREQLHSSGESWSRPDGGNGFVLVGSDGLNKIVLGCGGSTLRMNIPKAI